MGGTRHRALREVRNGQRGRRCVLRRVRVANARNVPLVRSSPNWEAVLYAVWHPIRRVSS